MPDRTPSAAKRVRYEGVFDLAWLRPGERVMSAGDGTGAAVIISPDGIGRRLNVGDEMVVYNEVVKRVSY